VDRRRLGLQAEEGLESLGDGVAVGLPPALLPCVAGELDERLAVLAVDSVQGKQGADVGDAHGHRSALDLDLLGERPVELPRDLLLRQAVFVAKPPELVDQPSMPHGRAESGHWSSPLVRTCSHSPRCVTKNIWK
jgi:hypothetical protein